MHVAQLLWVSGRQHVVIAVCGRANAHPVARSKKEIEEEETGVFPRLDTPLMNPPRILNS